MIKTIYLKDLLRAYKRISRAKMKKILGKNYKEFEEGVKHWFYNYVVIEYKKNVFWKKSIYFVYFDNFI